MSPGAVRDGVRVNPDRRPPNGVMTTPRVTAPVPVSTIQLTLDAVDPRTTLASRPAA